MGTVIGGFGGSIGLSQDKSGRTYVTGLKETRKKLLDMGLERNLFEKWIKESAALAARQASYTAPVGATGNLAASVKAYASKTITVKSKGIIGSISRAFGIGGYDKRFAFGGVITAGTPARVPYARRVSYGAYMVAGQPARSNNSKRGYATRVWTQTVRTPGNAYMVKAREKKKPDMVQLLNNKIRYWIKQKGFETNGV